MILVAWGIVAWVAGGWVLAVCRVPASPGAAACRLLGGLGLAAGPLMALGHVSVRGASVGLVGLAFVCGLVEAGRWRRGAQDTDGDRHGRADAATDSSAQINSDDAQYHSGTGTGSAGAHQSTDMGADGACSAGAHDGKTMDTEGTSTDGGMDPGTGGGAENKNVGGKAKSTDDGTAAHSGTHMHTDSADAHGGAGGGKGGNRNGGEDADTVSAGGAYINRDSTGNGGGACTGGASGDTVSADSGTGAGLHGGAWPAAGLGGTRRRGVRADAVVRLAAVGTLAAVLLFTLVSALAPATAWDACVAHLALPKDYARADRMSVVEGNAYSAYPHLPHTVYTLCLASGGEHAAQVAGWLFGGLALLAAGALGAELCGRRGGQTDRVLGADPPGQRGGLSTGALGSGSLGWRGGLAAAAMLAATPVFTDQAGAATIDLACAAYVTAAVAALAAWDRTRATGWLALAGYLAGCGYGARHTALLACAIFFGGVLVLGGRRRFALAALFGMAALAGAAPWLLRSALLAGNPVYPFLAEWFGGGAPADAPITALGAHDSLRTTGIGGLLLFPWNLVMHPDWHDGWSRSPGGLVLALGLPGLLVGGRRARLVGLYALAGLAAMFFFRQHVRYLLPFIVPFMAVAACAVCADRRWRGAAAAVFTAGCLLGVALSFPATMFKLPVALGLESREDYLTGRVERYPAFAWANANLPRDEVILSTDLRSYYLDGPAFINPFATMAMLDLPPGERSAWLRARGIGRVMFPEDHRPPMWTDGGHLDRLDAWLRDPAFFREIHRMKLPDPRTGRTETVRFFEVIDP